MQRREFIAGLGSAAAMPLAARAQQPSLPLVGYLGSVSAHDVELTSTAAFIQGLKEGGYSEGQKVTVEYRWADGHFDQLPMLARDLAERVAVIATYDTASGLAAKDATKAVPVVFMTGADPIKFGLVSSLARPSGNVTGISFLGNVIGSKRLELLRAGPNGQHIWFPS
jgi:putative ABC transport system substrate-binding protein